MNDLLAIYALLNEAIQTDPRLLLANAVTWLDPMWQQDLDNEEGDGLMTALLVTRHVFPSIYAQAVERLRAGESGGVVGQFICRAITEKGIPVDDVEYLGFGIPLTGLGVVLEDPELYARRLDLIPILNLFGVHPEFAGPNTYTLDLPKTLYKAGAMAAESLVAQPDPHWKQVGMTLSWLFGCSGNSLVDYDDESLAEFQPLSWEEDEAAYAIEMVEECQRILDDAEAGIGWLEAQPDRMTVLGNNINRIYKYLKKGKQHERAIELVWPTAGDGDDRTAVAGAEFLFVRADAA